jgi:hypothetical protein
MDVILFGRDNKDELVLLGNSEILNEDALADITKDERSDLMQKQ